MKKTIIIFFSFVLFIVFSGCNPPTTTTTTTTTEKKEKVTIEIPNTQEECLAKGGTWKPVGIFPSPICNLPTTDGGKECTSSNDCEGSCLAVLTQDERSTLMKGEKMDKEVEGQCTSWVRNFGCIGFVENSRVDKFLCLD